MADRISSLDPGYQSGNLSIFPNGIDSYDTLYDVTNNAQTYLPQSLPYNARTIIANDGSAFPDQGLVKIDNEIIFYNTRNGNVFTDLKRGFVGSSQAPHNIGALVNGSVMAEYHNACKDAILNIESDLGNSTTPDPNSLNGILSALEVTYLAPKPKFRAYPLIGTPPLNVRFQNFSDGPTVRALWDFGDGTTSVDNNPIHTYQREGSYDIKLSLITSLGAQGIITKKSYITVSINSSMPFFYAETLSGSSIQSAGSGATEFTMVDQTTGNVTNRYWIWDDGNSTVVDDADIHTATHQYQTPGTYQPNLLIVFDDSSLQRAVLSDSLIVT